MDQKGPAAMLPIKRLAGVAPELNLANPLHTASMQVKESTLPLTLNSRQTPPGVQNRGISGPTKRTHVLHFLFKKEDLIQIRKIRVTCSNMEILNETLQ